MNRAGKVFLTSILLSGVSGAANVELGGYTLGEGPILVDGIGDNHSGLTFNPVTSTLFSVTNSPEGIHELNLDGSLIRTISLPVGIEDTEGITHLGGSRFAFLEERKRNVVIMDLNDVSGSTISLSNLTTFSLDVPGNDNQGLEGIAYDSLNDTVYVTKELDDRAIYSFTLTDALALGATTPYPVTTFLENPAGMIDLSGLHFDAISGSLLMVSHESRRIVEVATTGPNAGQQISSIFFPTIPQGEGVTMGNNREIYLAGEPNQLYRFDPPSVIPEPQSALLLSASMLLLFGSRRRGGRR